MAKILLINKRFIVLINNSVQIYRFFDHLLKFGEKIISNYFFSKFKIYKISVCKLL